MWHPILFDAGYFNGNLSIVPLHREAQAGTYPEVFVIDSAIVREKHANVVAEFADCFRQSADHVPQSAHLDKRGTFGCDEEDVHVRCPIWPVRLQVAGWPSRRGGKRPDPAEPGRIGSWSYREPNQR